MPTTTTSVSLTDVSTTQALPLGFEVFDPPQGSTASISRDCGERKWVYVKTDDALAIGSIVARKVGTIGRTVVLAPTSSKAIRVVGVSQQVMAAATYGFVLQRGIGEVLADTGGITADTAIVCGDAVAGRADDTANGTVAEQGAIGFSTETVAATALATCWIDCRG